VRWLARLTAGAAVALAVGLAALLAGRSDAGPAAVSSTSPADGATLAREPAAVELTFTRAVDPSRSHISVAGSARTAGVPRRPTPERLSQPIAATACGEVTVAYHVTFTDGAELVGSLRFVARPGNGLVAQLGNAADRRGARPVGRGRRTRTSTTSIRSARDCWWSTGSPCWSSGCC
jgi:methionine-rich copper-binding protein CopC